MQCMTRCVWWMFRWEPRRTDGSLEWELGWDERIGMWYFRSCKGREGVSAMFSWLGAELWIQDEIQDHEQERNISILWMVFLYFSYWFPVQPVGLLISSLSSHLTPNPPNCYNRVREIQWLHECACSLAMALAHMKSVCSPGDKEKKISYPTDKNAF